MTLLDDDHLVHYLLGAISSVGLLLVAVLAWLGKGALNRIRDLELQKQDVTRADLQRVEILQNIQQMEERVSGSQEHFQESVTGQIAQVQGTIAANHRENTDRLIELLKRTP